MQHERYAPLMPLPDPFGIPFDDGACSSTSSTRHRLPSNSLDVDLSSAPDDGLALFLQQLQADDTELFLEQQPRLLDESHHHDLSSDVPLPQQPAVHIPTVDMLPPNEQQCLPLDESWPQNPHVSPVVPLPPPLPPTVATFAMKLLPSSRSALSDHDVIALLSTGPAAAIGTIPVHQQSWPPCAEDYQPRLFLAPWGLKGKRLNTQAQQSWPIAVEARDQPGLFLFKHTSRRCYHLGATPHTFAYKHGKCVSHLSCKVLSEGLAWRGDATGPASAAAVLSRLNSQWVSVKVNGPSGPEEMWRDPALYVMYSEGEVTPYVALTRGHRGSAPARGAPEAFTLVANTEERADASAAPTLVANAEERADGLLAVDSASQPPPPPLQPHDMVMQALLVASSALLDVAARLACGPLPSSGQTGRQNSSPPPSHGSTARPPVLPMTPLYADAGCPPVAAAASLPPRAVTAAAPPLAGVATAASNDPFLRDASAGLQTTSVLLSHHLALARSGDFLLPSTQPSAVLPLSEQDMREVLMSGSLANFQQHICVLSVDQLLDIQRHDEYERGIVHQLVTFGKLRPDVTAQRLTALKAAVGPEAFAELMAQINTNGSTPLHTAAAFAADDRLAPFEVLLFETPVQALLTVGTKSQWLVHHIAAMNKHLRAVQLCAEHILASPYGVHLAEVAFFDLNSPAFHKAGGPEALRAALAELDVAVLETKSKTHEAEHRFRLQTTYRRCSARAASIERAEMDRWSALWD